MGVSNIMTERFQLPTTTLIILLSLHSAHALFSLQLIVDIVFSDTPFLSREGGLGGGYRVRWTWVFYFTCRVGQVFPLGT